jgi:hypothetical protein
MVITTSQPSVPSLIHSFDATGFKSISNSAVGDLNGDGIADIISVGITDELIPNAIEPVALVFVPGLGGGTFGNPVVLTYYETFGDSSLAKFGSVHLADVDNDGDEDVVLLSDGNIAESPYDGVSVWMNELIAGAPPSGSPTLVASDPPDGYIDPRGEPGPDTHDITLYFDRPVLAIDGGPLGPSALTVTTTDNPSVVGVPVPPEVVISDAVGPASVVKVRAVGVLPAGDWTIFSMSIMDRDGNEATVSVRYGHLPCDMNQDGSVGLADASAFVTEFNGMGRPCLVDFNHDGSVGLGDVSAFVNLFNGNLGMAWNGHFLP